MEQNRELFIKAFMEAERIKYAEYQNEDNFDVVFSEEFKNKMKKLIAKNNRIKMSTRRTFSKALLAAIIAVIVMLTGLMSVSATREKLFELTEIPEKGYLDFELSDEAPPLLVDSIETAYTLPEVPEGFVIDYDTSNEASVDIAWKNKEGDYIVFSQHTLDSPPVIDNEHDFKKIFINDKPAYLYGVDTQHSLLWYDDYYTYNLSSDVHSYDELLELSKNLVEK